MKELSIEQKAKRFDEIIKKIRGMMPSWETLNYTGKTFLQDITYIIPELAGSEDEKIRKALIQIFNVENFENYDIKNEEVIAWLEKQGEYAKFRDSIQVGDKVTRNEEGILINLSQLNRVAKPAEKYNITGIGSKNAQGKLGKMIKNLKPADKVEPKFHEGDWVVYTGYLLKDSGIESYVMQVASVEDGRYNFTDTSTLCFDSEKDMRSWTIQDAKDGDLLADIYGIYIFDRFDECDERSFICKGAYQYSQKVYENEHMLCSVEVHPATKEQRDLLFQKMKEAGYEWDADKKELKKIEFNPDGLIEESYQQQADDLIDMVTEKSAEWSKEDEKMIEAIEALCDDKIRFTEFQDVKEHAYTVKNWLKSLKDRCTWKPSDEQMKALKEAVDEHFDIDGGDLWHLYEDLKKLREE